MDDLFLSDPQGEISPGETDIPADSRDMNVTIEVPAEPVVTFDGSEPTEPEEPAVTFDGSEPTEPEEPAVTFDGAEPYEPEEPSLTFDGSEPYEPEKPSLTFDGSEPYEPEEPSLTFNGSEPYEAPAGESAEVRYDEPYSYADYEDGYYDDGYYDDEYYDEYPDDAYPDDAYADDGSGSAAPAYYSGPTGHSYDPNGTEDERPVYGSYYSENTAAAATGGMSGYSAAGPDSAAAQGTSDAGGAAEPTPGTPDIPGGPQPPEPDDKGPYKSKYDAYRFVSPGGPLAGEPQPKPSGTQPVKNTKKKEGRKGGLLSRLLATALYAILFGAIASGVFLGALKLTGFSAPKQEEHEIAKAVPSPTPALGSQDSRVTAGKADTADGDTAQDTELRVPEVVEMCMPSMVAITNTTVQQYYDFFGGQNSRENVSAGSGIIVGETETELLIATNNHVVSNSSEIAVTFINDDVIAGTVKGTDADNDLAIVAVPTADMDDETKDAIRIISIGDSNSLSVGETVIAIGNALGYGQSVSRGVISALNREVVVDGMAHELIQTDASINPGNSGGALLNMRGELIGINEIKYVDKTVEGVGYAIPTAIAKPILDSLGAKVARTIVDEEDASYIGIMCIDVPSYYVQSGYPSGVYVSELTKGGPAEKAGLKEGDIITAMDGISVSTTSQLTTYLRYYAAGEEIDFSVSRLNEEETAFEKVKIKITLGRRKDSGIDESKAPESESQPEKGAENGGFDVLPDQKR